MGVALKLWVLGLVLDRDCGPFLYIVRLVQNCYRNLLLNARRNDPQPIVAYPVSPITPTACPLAIELRRAIVLSHKKLARQHGLEILTQKS